MCHQPSPHPYWPVILSIVLDWTGQWRLILVICDTLKTWIERWVSGILLTTIQPEISSIESCDAHAGVVWETTGDVFASNYPITAIKGFSIVYLKIWNMHFYSSTAGAAPLMHAGQEASFFIVSFASLKIGLGSCLSIAPQFIQCKSTFMRCLRHFHHISNLLIKTFC